MDNIGIKFTSVGAIDIIPTPVMQRSIWGKRTWKERLFTFPWHPFQRNKIVGVEPMKAALQIGNKIFCAPVMVDKIRESLKEGIS